MQKNEKSSENCIFPMVFRHHIIFSSGSISIYMFCIFVWPVRWHGSHGIHKINNDAHNRTQRLPYSIERVLTEWSDVENAKIKDNLSLARIGSNKR